MKDIIDKILNTIKSVISDEAQKKSILTGLSVFLFMTILQVLLNIANDRIDNIYDVIPLSDVMFSFIIEVLALLAFIKYMKDIDRNELFDKSKTRYIVTGSFVPFIITMTMFIVC